MATTSSSELAKMKRRATGLLVVAVVVYLVSRGLENDNHAWGYVRAASEAAMIGGLADWFAVTALFRHPLRLPIPHTAIIPTRKDAIGASLGTFVEDNFLSSAVITERIAGAQVAKRAGTWLADPVNARTLGDQLGDGLRGVAEVLDDDDVQAGIDAVITTRVRELDVATMLNQLVGIVGKTSYDRALKLNVIEIDRAIMLEAEAGEAAEEAAEEATEDAAE